MKRKRKRITETFNTHHTLMTKDMFDSLLDCRCEELEEENTDLVKQVCKSDREKLAYRTALIKIKECITLRSALDIAEEALNGKEV